MADLIIAEVMGGDGCLPLDEERSIGHWPSRELRNPEREEGRREKMRETNLIQSMSSKAKSKPRKQSSSAASSKKKSAASSASVSTTSSSGLSSGFLLTCDPPAKQFILHLNDTKIADKKFIIEDLDATHLLIKGEVREEITRKVEEWMDEVSLIYASI
jgi:hypothetical protein